MGFEERVDGEEEEMAGVLALALEKMETKILQRRRVLTFAIIATLAQVPGAFKQ